MTREGKERINARLERRQRPSARLCSNLSEYGRGKRGGTRNESLTKARRSLSFSNEYLSVLLPSSPSSSLLPFAQRGFRTFVVFLQLLYFIAHYKRLIYPPLSLFVEIANQQFSYTFFESVRERERAELRLGIRADERRSLCEIGSKVLLSLTHTPPSKYRLFTSLVFLSISTDTRSAYSSARLLSNSRVVIILQQTLKPRSSSPRSSSLTRQDELLQV